MLGSASKPTEQASRCGQECQELLHSLKMIGLNFFRRRIGGNKALEAAFFPEGLARALTLIGRSTREQGCQTSSKLQVITRLRRAERGLSPEKGVAYCNLVHVLAANRWISVPSPHVVFVYSTIICAQHKIGRVSFGSTSSL